MSAALLGVDPAAISRDLLALWTGKIAIAASRTFGHGGSNFPGKLARRIDPTLTGKLAGRNQQGIEEAAASKVVLNADDPAAAKLGENGIHLLKINLQLQLVESA